MAGRSSLFALVVAMTLAGCGGPMQSEELQRGVDSISSAAAEGALLAEGVAQDRTRSTFTRVQSGDIAEQMTHEAEKLQDAEASGKVARAKAQAVALAQDVSAAMGDLQVAPGDERGAAALQRRLERLRGQADDLSGTL
jgi:hypothetical protein